MEKKVIIEEINLLMETVNEQVSAISAYTKYIPQIEMDMVMVNTRELYERLHELKQLNTLDAPVSKYIETIEDNKNAKPKQETHAETASVAKQNIHNEVHTTLHAQEADSNKSKEKLIVPKTVASPEFEIKQEVMNDAENKPVEKTETTEKKIRSVKKTPVDLFSDNSVTIADKYKDENKSLNERFSTNDKNTKSIADKLHDKPIKDLKSAIGINDKFKFINELFDGNLQLYNDVISKLNGFSSFEEAGRYLDILKNEHKWTDESESFAKLTDMVIRRFL